AAGLPGISPATSAMFAAVCCQLFATANPSFGGSILSAIIFCGYSFDSEYYFSARVPLFEIAHRFCGLAQLVTAVDDGCHLPRLHEVAQQLQILFVRFRTIPDELLTNEPRQQIRFESPNHTSQRFRVNSCSSDSGKDADATRS